MIGFCSRLNFVKLASTRGGLAWVHADDDRAKKELLRARKALDKLRAILDHPEPSLRGAKRRSNPAAAQRL